MKKISLIIALIVCAAVMLSLINRNSSPLQPVTHDGEIDIVHIPDRSNVQNMVQITLTPEMYMLLSKAERRLISKKERIALLEKLGKVPDYPDMSDYFLAEETSWWGKRLNPEEFWKDKILWYDDISDFEARRRGRGCPPIPYEDPHDVYYSDNDVKHNGFHIEGSTPSYVSSERETAFWDRFSKAHPKPPNQIEYWLERNADWYVKNAYTLAFDPEAVARRRLRPSRLPEQLETDLRDTKVFFFPPECVNPEAYHWTYVLKTRKKYEADIVRFGKDSRVISTFFDNVYVDKKLITEPLTDDDMKAANAWKVAYLRRLRTDKWDESYINAYLKAWDLKETDVFGDGNAVLAR